MWSELVRDARVQRDDEFSDSEDEGEGGRRDRTSHRQARVRSKSPQLVPNGVTTSASTTDHAIAANGSESVPNGTLPATQMAGMPTVTNDDVDMVDVSGSAAAGTGS